MEAAVFEPALGRVASLSPQTPATEEKVRLKLKGGKAYDIPVIQSKY